MTVTCKKWFIPEGFWNPLCTNTFQPVESQGGCAVCVSPNVLEPPLGCGGCTADIQFPSVWKPRGLYATYPDWQSYEVIAENDDWIVTSIGHFICPSASLVGKDVLIPRIENENRSPQCVWTSGFMHGWNWLSRPAIGNPGAFVNLCGVPRNVPLDYEGPTSAGYVISPKRFIDLPSSLTPDLYPLQDTLSRVTSGSLLPTTDPELAFRFPGGYGTLSGRKWGTANLPPFVQLPLIFDDCATGPRKGHVSGTSGISYAVQFPSAGSPQIRLSITIHHFQLTWFKIWQKWGPTGWYNVGFVEVPGRPFPPPATVPTNATPPSNIIYSGSISCGDSSRVLLMLESGVFGAEYLPQSIVLSSD